MRLNYYDSYESNKNTPMFYPSHKKGLKSLEDHYIFNSGNGSVERKNKINYLFINI